MSTGLAVLVGALGVPLVIVPAFRTAEHFDSGSSKERHEETTVLNRLERPRHQRWDDRRLAIAVTHSASPAQGQTSRRILARLDGHRLSNGLLAPFTC